MDKTNLSEQHY